MRRSRQSTPDTQPVVTLKDIAEKCGVTKATVSMAFGSSTRIGKDTRARILAAAADMGYDPALHTTARRLAMRRHGREMHNRSLAVTFQARMLRINYFALMLKGMMEEISAAEYTMLPLIVPETAQDLQLSTVIQLAFARNDFDGLLFCITASVMGELLEMARLYKRPTAVVAAHSVYEECAILADEYSGAYAATRHLLALGHRHIFHCIGTGDNYRQRLAGVRQAMQDTGVDPDIHLHVPPKTTTYLNRNPQQLACDPAAQDATARAAADAFLAYLAQHPDITALMLHNDAQAITVYGLLLCAGYRVPEDYSLIGFDDTDPLLDYQHGNILTTVRLPLEEMGREAVRQLIQLIESGEPKKIEVMLPTELVIRRTTAPPRSMAPLTDHAHSPA